MPSALRVLLDPMSPVDESSACRGARVELASFGAGSSRASVDTPSAARMIFRLRPLDHGRAAPGTPVELGSIGGTLLLSKSRSLKFSVSSVPPPVEARASGSHQRLLPLSVPVQLALGQFEGESLPAGGSLHLAVPESVSSARFGELTVELEIGGAVEAASEVNDVLDLMLRPRTIEVQVVDEVGEAIAGLDMVCRFPNEEFVLRTDGGGLLTLENPTGGDTCLLRAADEAQVKALLEPRWRNARRKPLLRGGPYLAVVPFVSPLAEASVRRGSSRVSLQPEVVRASLFGALFDTNKTFLLPSVLDDLPHLVRLYEENPGSDLLVVGHADTAGSTSYNEQLSLERAESMIAYLTDDVEGWIEWYASSVPEQKRWGAREDRAMLGALADGPDLLAAADPIARFRESRGVVESGPVGGETRRALIREYMSRDDTTLPSDVSVTAHGCGEAFPAVETGDGVDEPRNRRVELFFFGGGLGVLPKPPGEISRAGSTAYPEWVLRSQQTHDFDLTLGETRVLFVKLLDQQREPIGDAEWTLNHAFGSESGKTGPNGVVLSRVPRRVSRATLSHPFGALDLTLEELPEITTTAGVQRRLHNLGYASGNVTGELDDPTRAAVLQFQADQGLEATGSPDEVTRTRLREVYGH